MEFIIDSMNIMTQYKNVLNHINYQESFTISIYYQKIKCDYTTKRLLTLKANTFGKCKVAW